MKKSKNEIEFVEFEEFEECGNSDCWRKTDLFCVSCEIVFNVNNLHVKNVISMIFAAL